MKNFKQNLEWAERAFSQIFQIYIKPEIEGRKREGLIPKGFTLQAAQVIFFPDGRKHQVRLNSEVSGEGKIKLKSGIRKKYGEPIFDNEVEGWESFYLADDRDSDCGHITVLRVGQKWFFTYDARYNKALSRKHLKTAEEFHEAAELSYEKGNIVAVIDNLFSSAELTARATLLSMPDLKFRKKANHKCIKMRYNQFGHAGNVPETYPKILNKLYGLRDDFRYLKGKMNINRNQTKDLLQTVRKMIDDAKKGLGGN